MGTPAVEAPRLRVGDVVITVVLLVVFVLAFLGAQDWPFRAAFFPKLLAGAGIGLAILKLIGFGLELRRPPPVADKPGSTGSTVDGVELVDDEEENDQSLEYIFGSAGARAWAAALGWVAFFFVALWLVGVYVIVPVFAVAYLRTAGKASWPAACLYAVVAGGVLWLVFSQLLAVPMPTGIFSS